MRSFITALLCLVCVLASHAQHQSAKSSSTPQREAQKAARDSHPQAAGEDVQALRQDLDRMKALVQQMQSNLAFVDTSQSPLKHQFQLEIDMWQTLITEMERRLAHASAQAAP